MACRFHIGWFASRNSLFIELDFLGSARTSKGSAHLDFSPLEAQNLEILS